MALKYTKVSIPEALFLEIQRLVGEHPEWGFRSASDLATAAIREKKERLEELEMQRANVEVED